MKDDQKNFILFAVFAALILFGWPAIMSRFFPQPAPATKIEAGKSVAVPNPSDQPTAVAPSAVRDRDVVLAETRALRVPIDTPKLKGSINLKGAQIDDLVFTQYRETVAKNSPPVRLLSPAGAPEAYFAGFGWQDGGLKPPSTDTVWHATGTMLAPGKPVTLDADNGQGQHFRIELSVDDGYMFTIRQTVANLGNAPVPVAPYSFANRGASKDLTAWTNHVGPMSVHNGAADYGVDYKTVDKGAQAYDTTGGWLGFTDKYWLTALIPDQGQHVAAQFRAGPNSTYQADYAPAAHLVPPGQQLSYSSHFYAGAKEVSTLDGYQKSLGIPLFENAIDWGWYQIIEKPIFYYLDWLFRMIGNFGVAIICLTITIRALLFPIAQRQFASMANMRAIQPKMKALQERHKDDKQKQQQEIMKLYKEEKVNPLAGCLPLLLQIPIMFALYKVLLLTTEMRHQPFVLWIHDLSAPDPATVVNLFGYLPFTPPGFLAIGVIPILLGVSMYLPDQDEPGADGRHAEADLPDHAVDADVRDGAVRGGPSALLDHLERHHHRPAEVALQQASRAEGAPQEEGRARDVSGFDEEAIEAARKIFAGPVAFLKSAPTLEHLPDPTCPRWRSPGGRTSASRRCSTRSTGPQRARAHLEHAGAHAGAQLLRCRRAAQRSASSTCRATASPRRPRTCSAAGATWSTISCAGARRSSARWC